MGDRDLTTTDRVANAAAVTGRVVLETPGAIWDEIHYDLKERPGEVLKTGAVSTGVGFGATALLERYPRTAGLALAGLLTYQGIKYGGETLGFLKDASGASDEASRQFYVNQGKNALGREGALLVESTPGLLAGGYLASRTLGTPRLYDQIGSLAERRVLAPARDYYSFRGPGSMRLSETAINAEGRVNVLEIGETLASRHAWTGVETGRTVDLLSLRASRAASGTAGSVELPMPNRAGRITFHTHAPDGAIGSRPSLIDIQNTRDFGIIQRGNQTTYFVGRAAEHDAALATGAQRPLDMKALILDSERQSAFLLESTWQGEAVGWSQYMPRYVDYNQARTTLKALDITKPWSQFESIPAITKVNATAADIAPTFWSRLAPVSDGPAVNPLLQKLRLRPSDLGPLALTPTSSIFSTMPSRRTLQEKADLRTGR